MVREEKRKRLGVRGDILNRGVGFSGEVKGNQGDITVRDISSAVGTGGDIEQTVSDLAGIVNGPIARAIFEIGRFIDDEGTYRGP